MKRITLLVAVVLLVPQVALASTYVAGSTVRVSGASPFDAACSSPAEQTGDNYPNSEVEPYVAVNPDNGANLIGAWQQDRWSNGGSRGNVVGFSNDGGTTWTKVPDTKNSVVHRRYCGKRRRLRSCLRPVGDHLAQRHRLPDEPVHR